MPKYCGGLRAEANFNLFVGESSTLTVTDRVTKLSEINRMRDKLRVFLHLTKDEYAKFYKWKNDSTSLYWGLELIPKQDIDDILGLTGQCVIKSIETVKPMDSVAEIKDNLISVQLDVLFISDITTNFKAPVE